MISSNEFNFLIGKNVILLRLGGELGVKSRRTRSRMVRQLSYNIEQTQSFQACSSCKITSYRNRLVIWSENVTDWAPLAKEISETVSGVSSLSLAIVLDSNKETIICKAYNSIKDELRPEISFAVRVRREGKHSYSSRDIARELGSKILESNILNLRVDLERPDLEIFLDIRGSLAFIYTRILSAMDGIPSKVQGKAIMILKPHYNSLLAAFLMKKRGVEIIPVFFETGHELEKIFQDYTQKLFFQKMRKRSIQSSLERFKDSKSLCFLCQAFCEAYCQEIAINENIGTIISPTCFKFNKETISLPALEFLESTSKLPVLRPIQFGYFGESLKLEVPDSGTCCRYRSTLEILISNDIKEATKKFFDFSRKQD
ncbi:MAG: hypothetical protein EAX86_11525 [Candidatus Heimdallarchaeota archaeon]|nr:hypothetical protein [Candidatus Heimdallarchaeota archaeon]